MYLKYIFKELIKRKSKTTTIILTIAIITTMLFLFSGVMNAYSSGIYQPFKNIGSDLILQKTDNATQFNSKIRTPFGKGFFDEKEIEKISNINHVKNISKSQIIWNFGKNGFITIEGIEPNSEMYIKRASQMYKGRFLKREDIHKAVLEKHFARFNHLTVGKSVFIGNKSFEIVGTLASEDNSQIFSSNIYLNIVDAQNLIENNKFNQIYLSLDELSNEELVKSKIKRMDNNVTVVSANSISASLSNVVNIYNKFYYIGTGIIILIVVLILLKINTINLLERKKDIGILRAVGWTKKNITAQITTELFIQTILGFFIGLAISFIILSLFGNITIQSASSGLNKAVVLIPITIPLTSTIEYFIMIIAISLLVSFILAKKISEIKPSENLRSL